jgi:predicted AAA+ superfamily ATPase
MASSDLPRNARAHIEESLDAFRGVAVNGARQTGKTTLAREVCADRGGTIVSLDDPFTLEAAHADPVGFLDRRPPIAIDEIQRGGDALLRAIKLRTDASRAKGAFLLTGSTSFLTVPSLSESLAGRIDLVELWPFSQGELRRRRDALADRLFGAPEEARRVEVERSSRADAASMLCRGGFPEAQPLRERDRSRWLAAYAKTLSQRDVLDFSRLRQLEDMPRLLRLLAARTAQEVNVQEISVELGMPRTTLLGYLAALEGVYLWHRLPAWSRNLTSKVVRHPKGYLVDSGLAARLLGTGPDSLVEPASIAFGPLLETFVASELARQRTWAHTDHSLYHFRDRSGPEVDLVLEARNGRVVGVEVKAAASVTAADFRGLCVLSERLGGAFAHGVVLYLGADVQPFAARQTAMPLSALWARE